MQVASVASRVEAYVQNRLPEYMRELTHLCSIDSHSYYKEGLDQMASYLVARLRDLGMDAVAVEQEQYGNDVLATLQGSGRGTVLLLGHTDTVYPVGTAEARPVRVEGDRAYGPGVCDMKGCILSAIYALEALLMLDYRSFGEVRFLCVSDEEITQRHCEDLLREAAQGCQKALVLEAARANGDIVSARKGCAWYSLTAHGRSAHAGVEPEKGANAIIELAHQIEQLQSLNGWRPGLTINVGLINGGTAPNVVPDCAQARVDVRYVSFEDRIEMEKRWREMLEHKKVTDVQLTLEAHLDSRAYPMVCTPGTSRLIRQAQEVAHDLGFSLNHTFTGGSSDGGYTSSYGITTLDGLGPIGGLDHSPSEYLEISSIAPRTALLAGLITDP